MGEEVLNKILVELKIISNILNQIDGVVSDIQGCSYMSNDEERMKKMREKFETEK